MEYKQKTRVPATAEIKQRSNRNETCLGLRLRTATSQSETALFLILNGFSRASSVENRSVILMAIMIIAAFRQAGTQFTSSFKQTAFRLFAESAAPVSELPVNPLLTLLTPDSKFIDKTHYLLPLLSMGQKKVFFGRPIGFGKTTMAAILANYLVNPNAEVFTKTKLYQKLQEIRQEYHNLELKSDRSKADKAFLHRFELVKDPLKFRPVLYLDFKSLDGDTAATFQSNVTEKIKRAATSFGWKIDSKTNIGSLRKLLKSAQTFNPAVIINEVDAPLRGEIEEASFKSKEKVIAEVLAAVSGAHSVFITGVAMPKLSEPLKGIEDISFQEDLGLLCGFTEEEVKQVFHDQIQSYAGTDSLDVFMTELKKWYHGFSFSKKATPLFNPTSILHFMKTGKFQQHWVGEPVALEEIVTKSQELSWQRLHITDAPSSEWEFSTGSVNEGAKRLRALGYYSWMRSASILSQANYSQLGVPNEEARLALSKCFTAIGNKSPVAIHLSLQLTEALKTDNALQIVETLIETMTEFANVWTSYTDFPSELTHSLAHLNVFSRKPEGTTDVVIYGKSKFIISANNDPVDDTIEKMSKQGYCNDAGEPSFIGIALRIGKHTGKVEEMKTGLQVVNGEVVKSPIKHYRNEDGKLKEVKTSLK